MAEKVAEGELPDSRRPRVSAPYIPLAVLRQKMHLTQVDVCELIYKQTGIRPERATISAIEQGHRGASVELIEALAQVYEIDPSVIDTAYTPRHRQGAGE
jgi:transcriptional regulator with XRE-family HTH domain